MSDFIPLCSPGGRAFSRAAFLTPEDLASFQQEIGEPIVDDLEDPEENEEMSDLEFSEDSGEEIEGAHGLEASDQPEAPPMYTQEEVSRLQTESFQLGLAEGRQGAEAQAKQLEEKTAIVENLAEELQGLKRRLVADIHTDIGNLVIHASKRVVGETLAVHPPALMKLVEDAMARLPGEDEVLIVVRPQDEELVRDLLATRRDFVVEVDENLEGGCVVRSSVGEVEASLEAAFEGLSQAVADWVEEQR